MKVLISGSGGFIGSNLKSYLGKNAEIHLNYIRRGHQVFSGDVSWENLRISKDTDVIVHLAGESHDIRNVLDPEHYYNVNFLLTQKLYDSFLASNAEKFIFISSVKAVADVVEGELFEDASPQPQSNYGKSKLRAEQYIAKQELPAGKKVYILRPCMVYGPGAKGNIDLLYRTFIEKQYPYPFAAFVNKRSFLSVENLCFVIDKLIRSNIPSGIYNLADDEPLSTNEVLDLLGQGSGVSARFWAVPKKVIKFMATIGDNLKLTFNRERLRKITGNYIVNNQKIRRALQTELPVTSRNGIIVQGKAMRNRSDLPRINP